MPRALSSGWTCTQCGAQFIRTIDTDAAHARDRGRPKGVQSKCPACGHTELVTPEPGVRIISIRYDQA